MNPIRVAGGGEVSFAEFEAMLLAYLNAGAPLPVLEGTTAEKIAVYRRIAAAGDSQMQALANSLMQSYE